MLHPIQSVPRTVGVPLLNFVAWSVGQEAVGLMPTSHRIPKETFVNPVQNAKLLETPSQEAVISVAYHLPNDFCPSLEQL